MDKFVNIEKNIIESAKIVSCKIDDAELRKRAYALNIAANTVAEYLNASGVHTDSKLSLFRVPSFAKNLELADIYVNGARFDVRISFDGKTFCIPKVHEKYDAQPFAYIVISLDKSLKTAEILGYAPVKDLNLSKNNAQYYCFENSVLKPMDGFKEYALGLSVKIPPYSSLDHEKIKDLCAGFIDDQISESEKIYFIKHVISCPVCREAFCDMNDFDTIVSQLKNYNELLNDSTLSVLSGNKKEFDEAYIANLGVVENAAENTAEPAEENAEESVIENVVENVAKTAATTAAAALDASIDAAVLKGVMNAAEMTDTLTNTEEPASDDSEETSEQEFLMQEDNEQQDASEDDEETENNLLEDESENADLPALDIDGAEDELLVETDGADFLMEETAQESEPAEDIQEAEPLELTEDSAAELELEQNDSLLQENDSENEEQEDLQEEQQEVLQGEPAEEEALELAQDNDIDALETEEPSPLPELDGEDLLLAEDTTESEALQEQENVSLEEIKESAQETAEQEISEMPELLETDGSEEDLLLQEDTAEPEELEEQKETMDLEEVTETPELLEEQPQTEASAEAEEPLPLSSDVDIAFDGDDDMLPPVDLEDLELLDETAEPEELTEVSEPELELQPAEEAEESGLEESSIDSDLISQEGDIDLNIDETTSETGFESGFDIGSSDIDINTPDAGDDSWVNAQEEETEDTTSAQYFTFARPASVDGTIDSSEVSEQPQAIEDDDPYKLDSDEEETGSYQEPVELKYDDEDEDTESAEPIQAEQDSEYLIQKDEAEMEQEVQNEEIQNLMDDDLFALLSDDDSDSVQAAHTVEAATPEEENASAPAEGQTESDETIESLFDNQDGEQSPDGEENVFELAEEPVSPAKAGSIKKAAISAGVVVLLAAAGAGAWFMNHQKAANSGDNMDLANQGDPVFDFQNQGSEQPDTESGAVSQDINKSMANSFSDKPAAITITKISWQVSEKLAQEASVKEYLQTAGKNIQMNLQNDLANAADVPFNTSVKISVTLAPDNTLKGMQVLESSGSDKIDESMLRSIKNTLKYVSVPKLKDYKSDYFLTLIINF